MSSKKQPECAFYTKNRPECAFSLTFYPQKSLVLSPNVFSLEICSDIIGRIQIMDFDWLIISKSPFQCYISQSEGVFSIKACVPMALT